jgi:hypothetical protein
MSDRMCHLVDSAEIGEFPPRALWSKDTFELIRETLDDFFPEFESGDRGILNFFGAVGQDNVKCDIFRGICAVDDNFAESLKPLKGDILRSICWSGHVQLFKKVYKELCASYKDIYGTKGKALFNITLAAHDFSH